MKKYRIEFLQFTETERISSNCAGITFVNIGTGNVLINNFPVVPGASLSIDANENEIDVTEYNLNFLGAPGTLWVVKKIYV